jgi:hypothetical protein
MDSYAKREVAILYLDEYRLPEISIASLALKIAFERRGRINVYQHRPDSIYQAIINITVR